MIRIEEAFRILDETAAAIESAVETVPVRDAHGRVTASDQRSKLDLPPFDKSAMDGFAVLSGDEREEYRLLETVAAGQVASAKLEPGTTVKVMTGAPVPDGAGRVIMVEHTEEGEGLVRVLKHDAAANICGRGEDVRVGNVVVPAGTLLGSLEIANLIACGITEVDVARRPRIAVISTGDEIVDSPDQLAPGRIMNSNGPMLSLLAREHGLDVSNETTVPDRPQATAEALREALALADVVVMTGGVSVGEFDYVIGAMSGVGLAVHFSRLAIQPGKPTVFASAGGKLVFGLPGNPVSVFVTFHLFVLRAAAHLLGLTPGLREFRLKLAADYRRRRGEREAFVPARLDECGAIRPVEYHGSAHLAALVEADGFFRVPMDVTELKEGDEARFMPTHGGAPW